MQLGIYRRLLDEDNESARAYERLALYDFDSHEWDESSDGRLVSKASEHPSPEELKARFQLEQRDLFVVRPERMNADDVSVIVTDSAVSVEEGHQLREERGGPLLTRIEKNVLQDQNKTVVPDDFTPRGEISETLIRQSDYEGFDFADHYDFEFSRLPGDE